MRALLPALALLALGGFCAQASAQAQCPELTRLRSEAVQAQKPLRRSPMMGGCELYIRASMAWRAVFEYADENREMCDISTDSLADFEKYYREALSARNNVCAGRPARSYPAEIIRR
jgi:hypothetical protein